MTDTLIAALAVTGAAAALVAILFAGVCLVSRFKRGLGVAASGAAWVILTPFRLVRGIAESIADDAAYLPLALFGLALGYLIFS